MTFRQELDALLAKHNAKLGIEISVKPFTKETHIIKIDYHTPTESGVLAEGEMYNHETWQERNRQANKHVEEGGFKPCAQLTEVNND